MTKLDKLFKAHKLAIKTGDFSLLDEIHHPEFSIYDPKTGFTNNYDYWKVMLGTSSGIFIYGPRHIVYESDDFVCLQMLNRRDLGNGMFDYYLGMTGITFQSEKVIKQSHTFENLDDDPSEGQNWNWEDYK